MSMILQKAEELKLIPRLETTVTVAKKARGFEGKYFFMIDHIKAYLHANWDDPIERDRTESIFSY